MARQRPASRAEPSFSVPGLYASLLEAAAVSVVAGDARTRHGDYLPGVDKASRRVLDSTSPVTTAARRRLASLEAGESQLVPLLAALDYPGALEVPFIAEARAVPDTAAEQDALCWLVRVEISDRVSIGQTRAQMQRQAAAVADGFVVGRVGADGEYVPRGFNPETSAWQDITDADDVVFGDVPEADGDAPADPRPHRLAGRRNRPGACDPG